MVRHKRGPVYTCIYMERERLKKSEIRSVLEKRQLLLIRRRPISSLRPIRQGAGRCNRKSTTDRRPARRSNRERGRISRKTFSARNRKDQEREKERSVGRLLATIGELGRAKGPNREEGKLHGEPKRAKIEKKERERRYLHLQRQIR